MFDQAIGAKNIYLLLNIVCSISLHYCTIYLNVFKRGDLINGPDHEIHI